MFSEVILLSAGKISALLFATPLLLGIGGKKSPAPSSDDTMSLVGAPGESGLRHIDIAARLRSMNESPEVMIDLIHAVAIDFFQKRFHVKKNAEYSELITFFTEKNLIPIATFCDEMLKARYGGVPLTKDKIADIISDLELIIDKTAPNEESKSGILGRFKVFEPKHAKQKEGVYLGKKTQSYIRSKLAEKKRSDKQKIAEDEKKRLALPTPSPEPIPDEPLPDESAPVNEADQDQSVSAMLAEEPSSDEVPENTALSLIQSDLDEIPAPADAQSSEGELIESIDDLGRIKDQISQKKKAASQEEAESQTEATPQEETSSQEPSS